MKKVLLLIALGLGLTVGSANHLVIENGKKVEYVKYEEGQADTTFVDGKIAFVTETKELEDKLHKLDSLNKAMTRQAIYFGHYEYLLP